MTFIFGSNLKMNHDPGETRAFVAQIETWLSRRDPESEPVQLWMTPSFINLTVAVASRTDPALWIGAQNSHWLDAGAYTAEISPAQLKACAVDFVLLGHAERRAHFGETDEQIALKVGACTRHGLGVMLCVGEPREAYEGGRGASYVDRQLENDLGQLENPTRLSVLYEPVWAIGDDGRPAEQTYVAQALESIREFLRHRYARLGEDVPILYGGSVNAANAAGYAMLPGCGGLGVGRAAWRANDYIDVLDRCLQKRMPVF